MKIKLNRAQMSKRVDYVGVDVTVKGAQGIWSKVAPTWDMVMRHKQERISDAYYAGQYLAILEQGGKELAREIWHEGKKRGGKLVFRCYCPDGKFCHTHLLIDWLVENYEAGFEDGRSV
jgi:uncharacterized protein YeaO (DUF488 family)